MKPLDPTYQVLYSELTQRALDAAFSADFSVEGRFVTVESRGRKYWYFDTASEKGGKSRRYVGPVDDPEISRRVEAFKDIKADHRARRKLVSTLVREAYLPRPDATAGAVVQALSDAGFFRLRGVLVGTVAFQCYPALLGMRLTGTALQTADTDFAQFHSISVTVGDALPPVLETLREIDPTFREIPSQGDQRLHSQYAARSGYRVEFLTPNTGSDEYAGRPAVMPALGGASAQPLRFLDFLIHQPVRAVLLHGAGVPVLVPAPERYAVHKLIIAARRLTDSDGTAKSMKDRAQAVSLIEAICSGYDRAGLGDVFMEAWDRGPHWRDCIAASLRVLKVQRSHIAEWLAEAVHDADGKPSDYGLTDGTVEST